jgi:hypothetical protein
MRAYILAACLAATFVLPAAAIPAENGSDAGLVQVNHRGYSREGGRWGYGTDCRELRRACLYKEELGEQGRGNCQRYRELCR